MSPASPSLPSDTRLKWRKRKRENHLKRQKPQDEDEEDEEEEDDPAAAAVAEEEAEENGRDSPAAGGPAGDPVLDLREAEVLSDGGHRVSDFPAAVRRAVNRPHPSVLAIAAAAAAASRSHPPGWTPPFLENISHGQLQALSTVLPDHPSLQPPSELEKPSAYVCTPPPLMEGRGVAKRLASGQLLLVPMHSEWFSPSTVHRLERQVVPQFFSGKLAEHTPEKYITLRNRIIAKYLENPGQRLTFADCHSFVSSNASSELYDLSRIVRFLDNWGIINYLAATSVHTRLRLAGSLLREDANGELMVQTPPLRSIDSLILFDRPKCSVRPEDVPLLSSLSVSASEGSGAGFDDLDARIRERLSEHLCSYCSRSLPGTHYQSQKEADIILCTDCYHNARFITGHSSLDFLRVDSKKDTPDLDGDNWTDQETLLLLEALEKYNDNWNEIAEHVGTKSKAQCILHFIRLPMEDGLLENIEIPHTNVSSNISNGHSNQFSSSNANGDAAEGVCLQDLNSGNELPFANSANPVMSLVAFLASAIGPRVAATCASASLSILTKGDSRLSSGNMHGPHSNFSHQKAEASEDQVSYFRKDSPSSLDPDCAKYAAKCGLSAAAMKAKLFADQEEREIQRLAATIINNQLKRLELKLKQFAEVETMLMKDCEQVERTRQRLSAERVRMISGRLGLAGTTQATVSGAAVPAPPAVTTTRLPVMPATTGQVNIQQTYGNNLAAHPQMSFIQRQQQMFAFGPRLPLSAINPSASAPPQNIMFNSGVANTSSPNHHPLLRPSSGNNMNIG